ncbi:MAG TPA: deoxyribodipyrimidine photo-lyase [Albitalea sp.]|uniref:cryptochrome/photolyase family protein n=1 Tax=Piscinibacter sp. TaxID=1903157 RepID=UPI002ED45F49
MTRSLDAALVWFRRDLRADDQAALYHALKVARRVWCLFVLDREILDPLLARGLGADRRVEFIVDSLAELDAQLAALAPGARLIVQHGPATQVVPRLARALHVQAVYANHDDDPAALTRDARVRGALADAGIAFHTSKDHVVFERSELLTTGGPPYSVFTPYKKAWLARLEPFYLQAYPVARYADALAPLPEGLAGGPPTLTAIGFQPTNLHALRLPTGSSGAQTLLADFLQRIDDYAATRDFPAVKGPSYLSVHVRFGTVSIRRLAREAHARMQAGSPGAAAWLGELIWRDFFHQVLHHHPHVAAGAFRPAFDAIRWEHGKHADDAFAAWCAGRTGYPLVDAAMAQINQTGYMHNRLRMVAASFLVKDLGIDWRRGEAWFADHLIDHDLAANNGGWQWAASTGCDAQPWFRIFNPQTQSRRFDPQGRFIRRYLPQLAALPDALIHAPWLASEADLAAAGVTLGTDYPRPIVDHDSARAKTLARYGAVKDLSSS